MAKKVQQNFIEGSVVLVAATAIVKVLGALYRIFLTDLIGTDGMGFYSTAYDIYLPIYSIAMAGLPIALSKMVAEFVAKGKYKDVQKTMSISKKTFLAVGIVGTFVMVALAFVYSKVILNDGETLLPILAISPCLFFCCLMSAYRGYYEGLRNMTPTSISQVIESAGKLIFGYAFAYIIVALYGTDTRHALSLAAVGALLGIAIGTVASSGYLIVKYKRDGVPFTAEQLSLAPQAESSKKIFQMLMAIAIPVVLASLVSNITSLIDVTMVKYQLNGVIKNNMDLIKLQFADLLSSGEVAKDVANASAEDFPPAFANSLYGMHRGYAYSIYNLVPVITSVFGISAIPTLATAWSNGDKKEVKSSIETVTKTTALVALPIGAGIIAIPYAMLNMLYGSSAHYALEIIQHNLRVLGVCAIFCGLVMPITNMLQAIGKAHIPLITMAIGATLKIITNLVLVSTPEINIYGVPYGTTICYTFIFVSSFLLLLKYAKSKFDWLNCLIKPAVSALGCGLGAYFANKILAGFTSSRLVLLAVPVAFGAIIYVFLLAITKALSENDIKMFPKGEKLAKILAKAKIIR